MSIADFMEKNVITVASDTKVNFAVNIMKENKIHRLPVVDNGQLVGIFTERDVEKASPSKATSLSIYEYNYLFNKMLVSELMTKNVKTIQEDAFLEDAIYTMRHNQIGVLPVMQNNALVGIITNNDILDAFLDVTDYFEKSSIVQVFIEKDRTGVIFEIGGILAKNGWNIQTLMVTHQGETKVVEIHVDSKHGDDVAFELKKAGFEARKAPSYQKG